MVIEFSIVATLIEGKLLPTEKEHEGAFWSAENVCILIWITETQIYSYVRIHQAVHLCSFNILYVILQLKNVLGWARWLSPVI